MSQPGSRVGYNLETIVMLAGTPLPATPITTPTFTPSGTPVRTPVPKPTPTATETLGPQAGPTAAAVGTQADFNAQGLFVRGHKSFVGNLVGSDTLWTSSNNNVLQAPQPGPDGMYQALNPGCACAVVSSGGVSSLAVSVGVVASPGDPTPVDCMCATPAFTPTATPKAVLEAPDLESAQMLNARSNGILQWIYNGASPIQSQLAPSSDGNLYFTTRDGFLHAIDDKGHERWARRSYAKSIAVSPGAVLYALAPDGSVEALDARSKALWNMSAASARGPLAASSAAVYFQEDKQLIAAASPGVVQWRANAPDEITSAALADDGTIVAASDGASVIAIASNGGRRWSFSPDGGFKGEVAVRGDSVYLGSTSGRLYALAASSGAELWHFDTSAAVIAGPVVNPTGPVFFASDATYALTADGELGWSQPSPKGPTTLLASDGAGGLFVALDAHEGVMLNSDGTSKWATRSFGQMERAAISASGVLYVAADGRVYAVK